MELFAQDPVELDAVVPKNNQTMRKFPYRSANFGTTLTNNNNRLSILDAIRIKLRTIYSPFTKQGKHKKYEQPLYTFINFISSYLNLGIKFTPNPNKNPDLN